jgi:hypothetical protein
VSGLRLARFELVDDPEDRVDTCLPGFFDHACRASDALLATAFAKRALDRGDQLVTGLPDVTEMRVGP